jgi:uncharacterized protein YjbI with pentapeptide repeats
MVPSNQPERETCAADSCSGVRLTAGNGCWAHAHDQDVDAGLKQLGEDGDLDARGVPITAQLLQRLLRAAPTDPQGRPSLNSARFSQATFTDEVSFNGVVFNGQAQFDGAAFEGEAGFGGTTFEGKAGFNSVTFEDDVDLDGAAFADEVDFGEAIFKGLVAFNGATFGYMAQFDGATFEGEVDFGGATFQHEVGFDQASFEGEAGFSHSSFEGGAGFRRATFKTGATFNEVSFDGWATFDQASFEGDASFGLVSFKGGAGFRQATFKEGVAFDEASFEGWAQFDDATFEGEAEFNVATFKDRAWFPAVTFKSWAAFYEASFEGWAQFDGATFEGEAGFSGATFKDGAVFSRAAFEWDAWFTAATFEAEAYFQEATFETAREFGPVRVRRQLDLDRATFKQRVRIEAAAATLCARRAQFPTGVQLRLRWAQIVLDDADFAAPCILTGVPPSADLDQDRFTRTWRRLPPRQGRDGRPRLLSLRRADVAGLTIADADLRACRFLGAHNLDKLRVEGDASFGYTPRPWRWTTRQTLAEEHHWRATRAAATGATPRLSGRSGWYPAPYRPPDWLEVEEVPPGQIAGLYRALRKGREDNKDEPGAADFYYGEMEMRRHARHEQARQEGRRGHWGTWAAARVEHAILWLYWLVSGYALRAWRALVAFAALLVLFAALCAYGGGFDPYVASATAGAATTSPREPTPTTRSARESTLTTRPSPARSTPPNALISTPSADTSFGGALVYGARTVIGLGRDPQPRLTRRGDVAQVLLRLLGPVLLGLAILSVRGRVKR